MKRFLFLISILLLSATSAIAVLRGSGGSTEGSQTRVPTGTYSSGFSSSSGTAHEDVDDPVGSPDDDTTYIYRTNSTVNHSFSFSNFSVSAGATITRVRVRFRSRYVSTSCSLRPFIMVGGSSYSTYDQTLTTSYDDYVHSWNTNPATSSAWTVDDVNGSGANPLQYLGVTARGMDSGDELRCTQVYIEVEYE